MTTMQDVARYTAPYQLGERISVLPVSVWTTLFPAFSTLDGANDRRGVQTLLATALKLMAFLMGAVILSLIFAARDVVLVFLGRDYVEPSTMVFQILCFAFWVNALAMAPHAALQACNRPDLTAKLHALETPLHLCLLFLFIRFLGVPGVALAWFVRATFDCLALLWLAKRQDRLLFSDLRVHGLHTLTLLISSLALTGVIFTANVPIDWIGSIVGGIAGLLFMAIGWCLFLSSEERKQVARMVKRKGGRV